MSAVLPSDVARPARRPVRTGTILEVHRDVASLQALVPQWESLAAEAADPNPFYEHWMLLPALKAFGARELRCIAVWQDGTLAAIVPMRLERFRGLPVGILRSYRHRNMLYCAPLVRAKWMKEVVGALLDQAPAAAIEFDWIPAGGAFYGALSEALSARGLPWLITDAYERAVLLGGRDPRERYNSNTRNNLRRGLAKLEAVGKVAPVRLSPGDDVEKWTQDFMRLEASGWKGRAGTALSCREDDRRFVAEVFPEAFRRGRLMLTGLDLDGKPLARHVIVTAGEGAFSLKLAYDEAHERSSPGLLGEVENVRQFLATPGLRWLDSNTARESPGYWRVWKDRHAVQRVAVGLRGAGRAAIAALPVLRLLKRLIRPAQPPGAEGSTPSR